MEHLNKKPAKGILKTKSIEQPDPPKPGYVVNFIISYHMMLTFDFSYSYFFYSYSFTFLLFSVLFLTIFRDIKWDEMNILQTLHPPDKDYGFMKIDEPKTPYSYEPSDEADGGTANVKPIQADQLDSEALARKISAKDRRLSIDDSACTSGDDEEEGELTEEEKLRRKEFEMKRKSHYNEFQVSLYLLLLLKNYFFFFYNPYCF